MTLAAVILRPAFAWACAECGARNVERAVAAEPALGDDDAMSPVAATASVAGVQDGDGRWSAATAVECRHCGHGQRVVPVATTADDRAIDWRGKYRAIVAALRVLSAAIHEGDASPDA